jgi:hypothetical protein
VNANITVTQKELFDFLLNVAVVRPVFIWGPPGIGKSSIVQQFAAAVGLPCVSLLGSQLAPEDIIGVPQIESTPRSWHMLSDALHEYGEQISEEALEVIAAGCLSPAHAVQFRAFIRQVRRQYRLSAVLSGKMSWPGDPADRDVLYFLAQSFRAQLLKELPAERDDMSAKQKKLAHRAKALLKELSAISLEIAQMVVVKQEDGTTLPGWFMVDIVRDLPRLVERKDGSQA